MYLKQEMSGFVIIFLTSSLCLCLLLTELFKFLYRVWWTPICMQRLMFSRGIKGPSYTFLYGNTKEIIKMQKESTSRPMKDLSHNTYPRIHPHFHSWIKTYGVNFLCWFGTQAHLIVSEPELVKEILNNRDNIYSKGHIQLHMKNLLGNGLVASEGEKWSKMRKLANYAFHADRLKNMIPAMVASVEMMLERWKFYNGHEIEVVEEFKLVTSEVISRTAFGSNYIEGKNMFDMIAKLLVIINRNAFKFRLPGVSKIWKNGDDIEAETLQKEIERSILEIIKKREDKMMAAEVASYGDDFLGLLLGSYHETDPLRKISIQDVVDECKTFYVAGQETTNVLLSWTVLLLAIHTDWQEEARREVFKFLGGCETPSADAIAKLKTLSMIINESLRLYPPVVVMLRKAEKEVWLRNFTVPADTTLQISTLALHHDPQTWGEDVHLFKPERFSEGAVKATNNNSAAFLPFGFGPRTCVGYNFAIVEAKIALSMILQRYSFTLSPAYVHSPVQVITMRPEHGVQVMLSALHIEG